MILERILAALEANTAAVQALTAVRSSPSAYGQASNLDIGSATAAAPGPGALSTSQVNQPIPQTTDTGQPINADTLMALIQPHIGNDAIKGELGVAMRNMGINALPETQPHQYPALYQAFKGVLAKFGVGSGQPQGGPSSII